MFTLSTLLASPYAFGQPEVNGGKPGIVFEPIIVTGEKLERELKDTASSVSIKTAKEIDKEKTGSASVAEVLNDVPNVIYTDSVGAPIIRGQDTQGPNNGQNVFWGGTVPRATINLDGHYLNYNEMFFGATSVWDIDSIEVFRGPQTTSQGPTRLPVRSSSTPRIRPSLPKLPTRPRSAVMTPSAARWLFPAR